MLCVFILLAAASLWAESQCVSCHQSIVESYAKTGMARSVSKPRAELQAQRQWFHDFSGRRVGVVWQQGKMSHWMETKGLVETHEAEWAIGSGAQAKNYVVKIGDSLFQSPFAWYAKRLIWDMAPGFVVEANPTFYRPLSRECLQCHAGRAEPVRGTVARYADPAIPEPGIGCERCHGNPGAHLTSPKRGNIVNPASLPQPRRDAVCEACHLHGEARVFNPSKRYADYRPGMRMEDVFTIYVARKGADDTVLRVQSQSEQMAASQCWIASAGKMWCGSCHDAHREPSVKEAAGFYAAKCLECHKGQPAETHRRSVGDDCVRCHMPKVRPYDGSHAAHTDHWIRTRKSEERFLDRGEMLGAWREPAEEFQVRNLALAYLDNAERSRSLRRLREGLVLLDEAVKAGHKDGTVAYVAGLQYVRQKSPDLALPWLTAAVEADPADVMRRLQLAAALANTGKAEAAKEHVLAAIKMEPLLEPAYSLMAQIEPSRAVYWKDQYHKAVPNRVMP